MAAFVRIISQPAFSGRAIGVAEVAELLLRNTAHWKHAFLALDFGIEQVLTLYTGGVVGHRQITGAYLLTLAVRRKVKLLTCNGGMWRCWPGYPTTPVATPASNSALPPAAAVLIVTVCSAQKRYR